MAEKTNALSSSVLATSSDSVGAGLRIKGEVSGAGDLLVDGTIEGPIHLADHKLTVGPNGKLTSDIVAREITVHGSVRGNLRASERIEITRNGSVVGDLRTARISIEDGASVKGWIEIDKDAATAATPSTSSDTTRTRPAKSDKSDESSTPRTRATAAGNDGPSG